MSRTFRRALRLCAAVALLPAAALAQHVAHNQPAALKERDGVWAQGYSDLRPDPNVRFGRLPNGMRYAILHNATPTRQASLRLRIGSGSLEESDAQQGLAHMLEHMAFKGSTHVPGGEMIKILERHGLAFGPDTNAFTAWTQTVFMLDLPETDQGTLDTGLSLLRETAGELTLAPAALQSERGVVLSEERLRDTPGYRAAKAETAFLLEDQLAARRFPIGLVPVIQNAPASLVRAYYRANYRPERATLIVVGDVDVNAIEAQIRARFGDWRGVGPATPEPDTGRPVPRGQAATVVLQPGSGLSAQVAWVRPYDDAADTAAKRRTDTVEVLALQVLNRRLGRIAREANAPFLSASASSYNTFHSAKVTALSVSAPPGRWAPALAAAEVARREAVRFGLTQRELDREIVEYRTLLQTALAGAATRQTPHLASELVESVDQDTVFTDPAEDLALFEADVRGLTAAEATAALRAAFTGQGPLVSLSTPEPVAGGDAAVSAAFTQAEAAPLADATQLTAKAWPYTDFGAPGRVVERREVADLGVAFVRFANGVRLTVKPTPFRKDQLLVQVRFGTGLLDLSRERPSPTWAASAFTEGGLKRLRLQEIEQALADRLAGVRLSVDEDAFVLDGATRPRDFDTQLQLLTAYLAEPAFRPEAFERTVAYYRQALPQLAATPGGVLQERVSRLLRSGDARWSFPTDAELAAAKPDALRAMLEPALAKGPVEVLVTGDTTVDEAIAQVGRTLGALPARPEHGKPSPAALSLRFPAPGPAPVALTHTGRADQAVAYVAWPTADLLSDLKRTRRIRIAESIMERRLIDRVRIAEGATYSPAAQADASDTFPGYGYVSAEVETPPARIPGFYAAVSAITADMATRGVTADELERARAPRIETLRKAEQTNEFWQANLAGAALDPRHLTAIRTAITDVQAITPEDVRRTTAEYLTPAREWTLTVQPAKAP